MPKRRPRLIQGPTITVVVGLVVLAALITGVRSQGEEQETRTPSSKKRETYMATACELPPRWVRLIDRGGRATRDSRDLVVQMPPQNYMGGFTSMHSGPFDFLQEVPLVFYGPGHVPAQGHVRLGSEVTLADVAPTFGWLVGFDFPGRGRALKSVLDRGKEAPRLIVTVVIDGGGWNALERWPDAWPNLARMIEEGVNLEGATVGSSPSVTPATHATLSAGVFPKDHGVTGIQIRHRDGSIVGSFTRTPRKLGPEVRPGLNLRTPTFADLWDIETGNEAEVGMLSYFNYPLAMLGHGSAWPGGDGDVLGLREGMQWKTTPAFYSLPEYVKSITPHDDMAALDRQDGRVDQRWMGHRIDEKLDWTPALARWINRTTKAILLNEQFGSDEITDLFYINYKTPDRVGHSLGTDSLEQREAIASVDEALGDLIDFMDLHVGWENYVMLVTADHGQIPPSEIKSGWSIKTEELLADVDAAFDESDDGRGIIQETTPTLFFLDEEQLMKNNVRAEDIATFLSAYTIGDNVPSHADTPQDFRSREKERVFSAVFPGRKIHEVLSCVEAGE
ncbi:MAG: alkaline phosphatase family protein [Actinomycetota bacterium]